MHCCLLPALAVCRWEGEEPWNWDPVAKQAEAEALWRRQMARPLERQRHRLAQVGSTLNCTFKGMHLGHHVIRSSHSGVLAATASFVSYSQASTDRAIAVVPA